MTTLYATTQAKLNLSLNILGKRSDGYHNLHSVAAFCEVGDTLSVIPSDKLQLDISGVFADELSVHDNLVMRAAQTLQRAAGTKKGAIIHLQKNLPVASGVGGGSGDAATTLKLLRELWSLEIDDAAMLVLAASLGSDVPVCFVGKACVMEGIGERIAPLQQPFPPFYAILVNPLISVATPQVFGAMHVSEMTDEASFIPTFAVEAMHNDLQASATRLCPHIAEMIDALHATAGVITARMSGSGATCFGLYASASESRAAHNALMQHFPHYFVASGALS
jgi:4-diphosphocytidyl-2-C-methyl-D-erythritol kinase